MMFGHDDPIKFFRNDTLLLSGVSFNDYQYLRSLRVRYNEICEPYGLTLLFTAKFHDAFTGRRDIEVRRRYDPVHYEPSSRGENFTLQSINDDFQDLRSDRPDD